jgi:outer membrane lipoprotein-sorting protein
MPDRGFLTARSTLFALLLGCLSTGCRPSAPSLLSGRLAAPRANFLSRPSTAAAIALWKRTLAAPHGAAADVSAMETKYAPTGAVRSEAQFDAVEMPAHAPGEPLRYRLTYTAPARLRGVTLVSDGRSIWRYDPVARSVRRQSAALAPVPPELEEGIAAVAVQADGAIPEIESVSEPVAGRGAWVLALRRPTSGRILERRWVDTASGRTLRFEQYAGRDAHVVRRVELTSLRPLKTPSEIAAAAAALRLSFPAGSRLVDSRPTGIRRLAEAEDAAGRVHLPLHVRGFALRSIQRAAPRGVEGTAPQALDALAPGATEAGPAITHLLYRKGSQAISVFFTGDAAPVSAGAPVSARAKPSVSLQPGPDWRPVILDGARRGFTREAENGAAVAWANSGGGWYLAVAHMPVTALAPIAAAFAANRDDAPATVGATLPRPTNVVVRE